MGNEGRDFLCLQDAKSLFAECLPLFKGGLKGEPYEKPWPKSQHECIFGTLLWVTTQANVFFFIFQQEEFKLHKHGRSSSRKHWARSSSATSASSASCGSSKP